MISFSVLHLRRNPVVASLWRFGRCLFSLTLSLSWAGAQTAPPSLETYFQRARELESREDYAGAEKIYLEAAANYPQQPEVLKRLGLIYQTELKFQESIATFQNVLQQAPQYPEVNFYLGLSYFGLNQYEKAIDSFSKELEANPKYRRARFYSAQAYQSLTRNTDAIREYEMLLKDDPGDKRVLFELIRLLKSATVQAIKQLGNLDPDSDFMLVLKAEGYAEDEKYAEAIEKYQQLLAKNPNYPGVHFALGGIYYNQLDNVNAEREFRLALREDPNLPMANYYLADILMRSQRTKEAVPLLEIVVSASPQFMRGYLQLGKCYATLGKLDEALKLLLKAAELEPGEKMVHYQLGQLYARLKQPDKQQYHLELFQKLNVEERERRNKKRQEGLDKALQKESTVDGN
ncbi:MAG: tetratricopeptide repeat protein [Acidobacteriota bacterium]